MQLQDPLHAFKCLPWKGPLKGQHDEDEVRLQTVAGCKSHGDERRSPTASDVEDIVVDQKQRVGQLLNQLQRIGQLVAKLSSITRRRHINNALTQLLSPHSQIKSCKRCSIDADMAINGWVGIVHLVDNFLS